MKTILTFDDYNSINEEIENNINQYLFLMEADDEIIESLFSINENDIKDIENNKVNKVLKKTGLKFKKEGPGLVQYFMRGGKGILKMLMYAIKGNKEGVKSVMKDVTKEQILDVLLKLDEISLHLITAPIYFIEAATGWILWADIHKAKGVSDVTDSVAQEAKRKIEYLKNQIRKLVDNAKYKFHKTNLVKLQKDIKA